MTRTCIISLTNTESGQTREMCRWFRGSSAKRPCVLLDANIQVSEKKLRTLAPQSFCPIESGHGGGVKFNYNALLRIEQHPSWKAILANQADEKGLLK